MTKEPIQTKEGEGEKDATGASKRVFRERLADMHSSMKPWYLRIALTGIGAGMWFYSPWIGLIALPLVFPDTAITFAEMLKKQWNSTWSFSQGKPKQQDAQSAEGVK